MEIVKRFGKDHQILILEPQIAIMNQVQHELKQRKIKSFIYHSDTRKQFSKVNLNNPIISTYDSAHRLINKPVTDLSDKSAHDFLLLDPSKTIVIMDETHVLIQDGKADYDKSIRAIIEAGVPIIGFSATPSAWVTAKLLDIDTCVEISSSSIPKKEILPIHIRKNIVATLAKHIVNDKKHKKVVIYTADIKTQNKIKEEIITLDKSKNVLILNRPERMKNNKNEWKYLMKNGVLPKEVDVLIMNKVAQAGINIKDKDIDAVFLVGQFDPYGFIQYLGRTRNYKSPYYYVYNNYGNKIDQEEDIPNEDSNSTMIESILHVVQEFVDTIAKNEKFNSESLLLTFGDKYGKDGNGNLAPNKCVIAEDEYSQYGELHGLDMLQMVELMDSNIEVGYYDEIDPAISVTRQQRRYDIKKSIPKLISQTAFELVHLMYYLKYNRLSLDDLQYQINISESKRSMALVRNVPYIDVSKKPLLLKLISDAGEVGLGVPKLIAAARSYMNNADSLDSVNEILSSKTANRGIVNALKVKLFFEEHSSNPKTVSKMLKALEKQVGFVYQKTQWIYAINKAVNNIPGSNDFARLIYDLFCIFKDSQPTINGRIVKSKKLEKVIRNHDEYVSEKGIDYFA